MEEKLKELSQEISTLEKLSSSQKEILRNHGRWKGEDGKGISIIMRPDTQDELKQLMSDYFNLRNVINEKKTNFVGLPIYNNGLSVCTYQFLVKEGKQQRTVY